MSRLLVGTRVVWGHQDWCEGRVVEVMDTGYVLERLTVNGSPKLGRYYRVTELVGEDLPIPIPENATKEQRAMVLEVAYGATLERDVRKDLGI